MALDNFQAVRGLHGDVTVASRAAELVAGKGAIDVELDHWVELTRLLEDLKPIFALVFLRHEVQVLVVVHDLLCRLVLLSQLRSAASGHVRLSLVNDCRPRVAVVEKPH